MITSFYTILKATITSTDQADCLKLKDKYLWKITFLFTLGKSFKMDFILNLTALARVF